MGTMKKLLRNFVLFAAIGIAVAWYCSPMGRLQRLGYSIAESQTIVTILPAAEVQTVLEHAYAADLVELLTTPEFEVTHLADYLLALSANGLSVAETVQLVNHPDYDSNRHYTGAMLKIMYAPYYISANAERYFAMLDAVEVEARATDDVDRANVTLPTPIEIVALVNANRDRDFYTDPEPADLTAGELLLVNKYYYLTADYVPDLVALDAAYGAVGVQLERMAYAAFLDLNAAARAAGFPLYVTSGYRGYGAQAAVFDEWVVKVGADSAPSYAARPGYSEHQTGLALDVFVVGQTTATFKSHPAAAWLAAHAWEYGFILRYTSEQENLTGYSAEAWHFRYVGKTAAAEIHASGLTLEEYVAAKRAGLEVGGN